MAGRLIRSLQLPEKSEVPLPIAARAAAASTLTSTALPTSEASVMFSEVMSPGVPVALLDPFTTA
ncbi:hypothetical protein D3C78_1828870 [compost metagenome]